MTSLHTEQVRYRTQTEIENNYSRKNIHNIIKQDIYHSTNLIDQLIPFINDYLDGEYYESKQKRISELTLTPTELAIEILIAVLETTNITPIQKTVSTMAKYLGYELLLDGVKTATELLGKCSPAGVYKIVNLNNRIVIQSLWALEAHTQELIQKTKYLPPMIFKPLPWLSNRLGGYLSSRDHIVLGHLNYHEKNQSLDAINILQGIEWSLCDMVEYREEPNKPLDTPEKVLQFEKLRKDSEEVYQELIDHGNKFYFVWKYDKRGRMYSQGYHVNLQSTAYKKAILEFSKEELIQ